MQPIIKEITQMSELIDNEQIDNYVKDITLLLSNKENVDVIGLAAGRMGYALRAFIMRLCHMGFNASMIGDTNVPRVNKTSIILINSSSGETPSIIQYAQQAKAENGKIFLTSCSAESTIGLLSNKVIEIPVINSEQLMKSPYEQFSMLLYDYIVIKLMVSLKLNPEKVSYNHSILE
jgi:6-phospho-3-hexuloisomerase